MKVKRPANYKQQKKSSKAPKEPKTPKGPVQFPLNTRVPAW